MSARGFVAGCVVALAAFASSFADERRLVWCASVYGEADESAYAADSWEKNAELLKSAGFTDLIVAVGRGNMAHYPSERLARSVAAGKGVFAACLAACRARGIKVHAWRVCYRMHDDPAAPGVKRLRDELRAEGRLVKTFNSFKGVEQEWLCPGDPRNQEFEVEAIVDMARRSGADGVHLDYIRQRGGDCCCGNCRVRFEAELGAPVADWPAAVEKGGAFAGKWRAFREAAITKVVREASRRVRAEFPALEISAAVQKEHETYAQDWPAWLRGGFCDFVCPMDYTPHPDRFRAMVRRQLALAAGSKGKVYPGIGFSAGSGRWPDDGNDMGRFADEVCAAREENAPGFCLFDFAFGGGKTKRAMGAIAKFLREGRLPPEARRVADEGRARELFPRAFGK